MAESKTATKRATTKRTGSTTGFTAEEKAAMRERAKEVKAEAAKADGEKALLEKVAEMKGTDRAIATRLHAVITAAAPALSPKTWYGMPAYAKDGKVVCFFKAASKFDTRYATFGFEEAAMIDDGDFWPTSYGLTKMTPAIEKQIGELVKKAVS